MASSGPNFTGTGANDAAVGTNAWGTPTNITSSNNVYATVSMGSATDSQYLKGTNPGFGIPAGSIIDGILAEIEIKANNANAAFTEVKLIKGGSISGTDKSTGAAISTTEGFVSFGGSSDKWGLSLLDTDINASTFGLALRVLNTTAKEASTTVSVDSMRITVYYHAPTGGNTGFLQFFLGR